MVAPAVRAIGGVCAPSLARPMLQSANAAYLRGSRIEAAARLLEAVRRHLAALAKLHALDADGDAAAIMTRLRTSSVDVCCWFDDVLAECGEVLAMREPGASLASLIELTFELLDDFDLNRGGAA